MTEQLEKVTTDQLQPGDLVLSHGMRIRLGERNEYAGSCGGTAWWFPGTVENMSEVYQPDHVTRPGCSRRMVSGPFRATSWPRGGAWWRAEPCRHGGDRLRGRSPAMATRPTANWQPIELHIRKGFHHE